MRVSAAISGAVAAGLALAFWAPDAVANDGRDRYQKGYPSVFYHQHAPVAVGAGWRVLVEDMAGGADGDPAFRWAQKHALAVVEVAARHTTQALGEGPLSMPIFDLSAENGDTPVDFGWNVKVKKKRRPPAPRGRHPGGSHDGGLNLDLGYYLTSLKGKVLEEDYAACTEHYRPGEVDVEGKPKDAYMCLGPADRLDVPRQAFFVLELLKLHRDRFDAQLIDESGMDAVVKQAVRTQLETWLKHKQYGVSRQHLDDLQALFSHDRWGGWQRFHHHHIHLRIQPFSTTGPLRDAATRTEVEARHVRAGLLAQAHKDWPVALDAQLLSYRMERAVELHVIKLRERPRYRLKSVRFRLGDGPWENPDDVHDNFRYTFDLPAGLLPVDGKVRVEAELTDSNGAVKVIGTELALPRLDPRLFVAHQPGSLQGQAKLKKRKLTAAMEIPERLKPLVTGVRYQLYPAAGGEPELHIVDAGWFARPKDALTPAGGSRSSSKDLTFKLKLTRAKDAAELGLIEAKVMFSSRLGVPVPVYVNTP